MNNRIGQKIKLTSVEELLGVTNEESAMDLEVAKIRPFKDHPFKVVDDEKMQDLMESIEYQNGERGRCSRNDTSLMSIRRFPSDQLSAVFV